VHVVEHWKMQSAGFASAARTGHLNATGEDVEVEITEALVAKGGRTTEDAIF
jgi:hypothetical protein